MLDRPPSVTRLHRHEHLKKLGGRQCGLNGVTSRKYCCAGFIAAPAGDINSCHSSSRSNATLVIRVPEWGPEARAPVKSDTPASLASSPTRP